MQKNSARTTEELARLGFGQPAETTAERPKSRLSQPTFTPTDTPETTTRNPFKRLWRTRGGKVALIASGVVGILLLIAGIIGLYTYSVVNQLRGEAQVMADSGRNAYAQFKAQNLPGAEAELKKTQEQLDVVKTTYGKLAFYKAIPVARAYYLDGEHGLLAAEAGMNAGLKSVAAITPYADVLGFSGEGSFEGGTAEDRVRLILETLEKVTPILDEIQADVTTMEEHLAQINENRYPEEMSGYKVRENIAMGKALAANAKTTLINYRPIIEKMPEIAGSGEDGRKKYLVLFQNDNELRPTGGFLTAYSVIYIENGKVTPEKSDDIYELDQKFTERIAIPEALGRYLTTERYWNLRDMNTSPDFKVSMDQFFEHYKEVRGEPADINGIIAIDTHVLTELVKIVGPVEVPGYGTFTAENHPRCDCPQIIYALSEIITRPTPYLREDRKGIIGPLMQAILQKVYSSPRVYMAPMFEMGIKSIEGRHLQAYFFNESHQQAAEAINVAGRLQNQENAPDFLAIVNANLGGAKSNLFINYEVTQVVETPVDGKITKTVEITYRNNRRGDNCNLEAGLLCLNSTNRDWTRVYLPTGSELTEVQGFTTEPKTYEEAGFQVIDGFFILEPNSQAKIKLTYTVPYTDEETYRIKIWKQGGISPVPTTMEVTGGQEEILVDKDTIYTTEF